MLLLQSSCSDRSEVARYRTPKAPTADEAVSSEPESAQRDEVVWTKPEGWIDGRSSAMRMASFAIPLAGGNAADVSLTKLGGLAGGLLANVNRWRGQIGLAPIAEEELSDLVKDRTNQKGREYQYLELENEETMQAIYGAIYEGDGFSVFAKLTAPLEGARSSQESFIDFCDSIALRD